MLISREESENQNSLINKKQNDEQWSICLEHMSRLIDMFHKTGMCIWASLTEIVFRLKLVYKHLSEDGAAQQVWIQYRWA